MSHSISACGIRAVVAARVAPRRSSEFRNTATSARPVAAHRRGSASAHAASDPAGARTPAEPAESSRRDALRGLAVAFLAASASTALPDLALADGLSDAPAELPATPKPSPRALRGGTNWSVVVSGGYERKSTEKPRRIYEQRVDCEPNCRDLQAKRTEETPLVARFGSPDEREDVSVSIRGANTLKLTFLQIKDVTEFGDVNEAHPLRPTRRETRLRHRSRLPRGATRRRQRRQVVLHLRLRFGVARVLLTVAVEQGNAYLLGCTASGDAWERAEAGFRARRRRSGWVPNRTRWIRRGRTRAAAEGVTLPRNGGAPAESMNCKGPLPIFCSVETNDE